MASNVEIFTAGVPLPFKDYKSKGRVFSSSDFTTDLKKQAAMLGANAIIGVEHRDILVQVNGYFYSRRKTYE
jgi:hypothetical protein